MAGELRHKDVGTQLSKVEWEDILTHVFNSQSTGDMLYASSATQLSRLAISTNGYMMGVVAGVPTWFDHAGAADPHTVYRLESADHSHQTTGLQGGQLDHGLALTGLTDDDHTQYLKEAEYTAADVILAGSGAGTVTPITLAASQFLAKKATGAAANVTATEARTILNVADGANAYVHPNHSGEVTSVADGAQTIANDAVTYAKMQNVSATDKVLGRATAGAGDIEEIACTAAGRALIDDAAASNQRTTLGLGTMAVEAAADYATIVNAHYVKILSWVGV